MVINEELEYGVAVGARPRTSACRGGLIFFSLKDVSNPVSLGCDPQDGYVHDVSCPELVEEDLLIFVGSMSCLPWPRYQI